MKVKQPQLTQKIEKALLAEIDAVESSAIKDRQPIDSKPYLRLAELYRFHHQYKHEQRVLERFIAFDSATDEQIQKVEQRLQQVKNRIAAKQDDILQLAENAPTRESVTLPSNSGELSMQRDIESLGNDMQLVPHQDEQLIESRQLPKAKIRENSGRSPYLSTGFKFIALCVAYTGHEPDDEAIEISLILAEKPAGKIEPQVIESTTMRRDTLKPIPAKSTNQFGFQQVAAVEPYNKSKLQSLFAQADFVVSHNSPETERQVLAILIPELAEKNWYSIQKGIPWKALGFENVRLSTICHDLNIRLKSTTMGRAKAIFQILGQPEPFSEQTFLQRIYNLPPIKQMVWDKPLRKMVDKMDAKNTSFLWYGLTLLVIVLCAFGWYFFDHIQSLF